MSLANIYHLRRVADTSTKACMICYKPTINVMITPDNKDFFYICPAHLQDRNFCSAIVDNEGEAKRLKAEQMAKEIELVKKEYEEKQRKKKEREKKSDKSDKDDKESKDKDKDASDSKDDEKERDEKIDSIKQAETKAETKTGDGPRIFALHKTFYQMRIDRLRAIEMAKRTQQRLSNPSLFPSAPKGDI